MRLARHWHLIVYDIRCPKRLRKVHAYLKKQAYALQESVFAWEGTDQELAELQTGLRQRMSEKEDDIRGYRLPVRQQLHLFGVSPFVDDIFDSGQPPHSLHSLELLHTPEWLSNTFFKPGAATQAA